VPDTDSIVIIKSFEYRGKDEEFSNRYHFENHHPVGHDAWYALAESIWLHEKVAFPPLVSWVRSYGYNAGTEHSIWSWDNGPPATAPKGTLGLSTAMLPTPGDTAATVRWDTGELNSRGKRIYCRKYMHGVYASNNDADSLATEQAQALTAYATAMIDGSLSGGARYCGPQGANLSAPRVDPFLTTRTLKRRGKRPLP